MIVTMHGVQDRVSKAVDECAPQIIDLSHELHADPELGGEEHRARQRVWSRLEAAGFVLDNQQPTAPTALSARFGSGELVVACCIEVDALPDIGHACGHNVNGAATLGAAIALAEVADAAGLTILALVTPAEETTGGKIDLIEEGYFDDAHLAVMAHASGVDSVGNSSLAMRMWTFEYTGRPAHSAAAPWEGINALDASVIAQNAIALSRQQLPPGSVVSIVLDSGGAAVNVIPERAAGRVEMRSPSQAHLEIITDRVKKCLEAGAHATDCDLTISEPGNSFSNLAQDDALALAYQHAMKRRGRSVRFDATPIASTDFGNVSHHVPSLHPMIGYDVHGAAHHTEQFASFGSSPSADRAVIDAADGLAAAVVAVALDPTERTRLLNRRMQVDTITVSDGA